MRSKEQQITANKKESTSSYFVKKKNKQIYYNKLYYN